MGICLAPLRASDQHYGMTPELTAEHDLGDTIPAGGRLAPATPTKWSQPITGPGRTWTRDGQVMGR